MFYLVQLCGNYRYLLPEAGLWEEEKTCPAKFSKKDAKPGAREDASEAQ